MPIIDPSQLKSGDVLLSRGTAELSDNIVRFDGGDYSHAAVWTGSEIIEAALAGVRVNTLDDSSSTSHYIDVYRYKPSGDRAPVAVQAREFVGHAYGKLDLAIATALLGISSWTKNDWIQLNALYGVGRMELLTRALLNLSDEQPEERCTCVEVVVRSYANAGAPISIQLEGGRKLTFARLKGIFKMFLESVWPRPAPVAAAGAESVAAPSPIAEAVEWIESMDDPMSAAAEPTSEERAAGEELYDRWRATIGLPPAETAAAVVPMHAELPVDEIKAKRLVVGKDWSPGLVTPRQLQRSPTLECVGCVHQSQLNDAPRSSNAD